MDSLDLSSGKIIVDATVGTGGHSYKIAERISPGGRLIAIDEDEESLEIASHRLKDFGGSCEFVHANFKDIDKVLQERKIERVDGILFDLGISSFQLENPSRGFSFQQEGPLDMRLDKNNYLSAYDLVNNLNEEEISTLLWNFGQERWHNRIAHRVVEEREKRPISTTLELADVVWRALPSRFRYRRIHPATRTFQAMRIAVNHELETLEVALEKAIELLEKAGRICVISFHSLEDRIVKVGLKKAASESKVNIITAKPLVPSESEVKDNPSSRSAKFRAAERI